MNILFYLIPKAQICYLYEDYTIRQALEVLSQKRFSVVPIISREGDYKGSISEGDILYAIKDTPNFDIKVAEKSKICEIKRLRSYQAININADINDLMDIEEDFLKYIVKFVLENCPDEIDFFDKFVEKGLKEKLENVVNSTFIRIDHKEAIDLLKNSGEKWEFEPSYEEDIAKEHERWLTNYFSVPVFIKNWPAGIKAYYMKLNEDGKTVAGVDLEVPGAGELIGGSQREEKLDVLLDRMKELGVEEESIEWYVNLRRYGGCIHSGFGMGFERLIMYLTGIENIRDVIPYPRTPGSCEF